MRYTFEEPQFPRDRVGRCIRFLPIRGKKRQMSRDTQAGKKAIEKSSNKTKERRMDEKNEEENIMKITNIWP